MRCDDPRELCDSMYRTPREVVYHFRRVEEWKAADAVVAVVGGDGDEVERGAVVEVAVVDTCMYGVQFLYSTVEGMGSNVQPFNPPFPTVNTLPYQPSASSLSGSHISNVTLELSVVFTCPMTLHISDETYALDVHEPAVWIVEFARTWVMEDMDVLEVMRRLGRVAWRLKHELALEVVDECADESVCLKRWDESKD